MSTHDVNLLIAFIVYVSNTIFLCHTLYPRKQLRLQKNSVPEHGRMQLYFWGTVLLELLQIVYCGRNCPRERNASKNTGNMIYLGIHSGAYNRSYTSKTLRWHMFFRCQSLTALDFTTVNAWLHWKPHAAFLPNKPCFPGDCREGKLLEAAWVNQPFEIPLASSKFKSCPIRNTLVITTCVMTNKPVTLSMLPGPYSPLDPHFS